MPNKKLKNKAAPKVIESVAGPAALLTLRETETRRITKTVIPTKAPAKKKTARQKKGQKRLRNKKKLSKQSAINKDSAKTSIPARSGDNKATETDVPGVRKRQKRPKKVNITAPT